MAVYPIFTLPCRLRLCPTESKQQVGMFKLQPVEGFKERWDGPTSGMLETRAHYGEKWDRRTSFLTTRKTSFLCPGSVILWALPFSTWRHSLGCPSLRLSPLSAFPATYTQSTVEIFQNLLSLQNCSISMIRVCASFLLIPLLNLYVLIVTWAVSNYISADDGSVLAIYRSAKFVYFNFFPQHDPNKLYVKHED